MKTQTAIVLATCLSPFVLACGWFNVLAVPPAEVPALAVLGAIAGNTA